MARKPRFESKPLEWTIPGWYYRKSVGLLAGKRGGGKSQLIAWLTAQATNGRYIDGNGAERDGDRPLNVWINVQAEDPVREFWHPRLDLAGADPRHVLLTEESYLLPGSNSQLREDLQAHQADGFRPDILILESLATHFKNPFWGFRENRAAMNGLVTLAEMYDLTVVMACHFRKGKGSTVESAIGGQGILQNSAKAIHVVGAYPKEDSTKRVLACARLNGEMPRSLAFEQRTKYVSGAKSSHPYLVYEGPIDLSHRDVYDASRDEPRGSARTGAEEAAEWIVSLKELQDERPMKTSDLEQLARSADKHFSNTTFERARQIAGLNSVTDAKVRKLLGNEYWFAAGDADGRTHWVMLPAPEVGSDAPQPDPGEQLVDEAEVYLQHHKEAE